MKKGSLWPTLVALLAVQPGAPACVDRPKTSPTRPVITVVRIAPALYRVYLSGYVTVGGTSPTFSACALGLPVGQTVITAVTSAAVIDHSTGEELEDTAGLWFPFLPNATSSQAIQTIMGTNHRATGFLATVAASVTRPIPNRIGVSFCFTITTTSSATTAQTLQALSGAKIFADEALATGQLTGLQATLVDSGGTRQASILHYRFDRTGGRLRINYEGAGIAPTDGTVVKGSNPASNTAAGQFGASLHGSDNNSPTSYVYCDTGWRGGISGDLTVHWWMKMRNAPGSDLSYVFGGVGSWRLFTNGVASKGLWMRAWGGPDLAYPGDIQSLAARLQGVCVTLTLDSSNQVAQWYIDGVATGTPIAIPNGVAALRSTSSFKIGKHTSNTNTSAYDIDEFRLYNRVASAAEIQSWCKQPLANYATFGQSCGVRHGCHGGPPRVGSTNYEVSFNGTPNSRLLVVFGLREAPSFNLGRRFGLPPCLWHAALDVQAVTVLDGRGDFLLPLPIPNVPIIAGLPVDSQGLAVTPVGTVEISNPGSTRIEIQ